MHCQCVDSRRSGPSMTHCSAAAVVRANESALSRIPPCFFPPCYICVFCSFAVGVEIPCFQPRALTCRNGWSHERLWSGPECRKGVDCITIFRTTYSAGPLAGKLGSHWSSNEIRMPFLFLSALLTWVSHAHWRRGRPTPMPLTLCFAAWSATMPPERVAAGAHNDGAHK